VRDPSLWGPLAARYQTPTGRRRLLALDGGGIRGVLTLAMLGEIERLVGQPLCEYFDYIAGTSTGAILATGLALGMSVDELTTFYRDTGPDMFERTRYLKRLNSLYNNGPLEQKLKDVFGEHTDLKPGRLKTLLLIVTRNVTTDSPWPVSSNPEARYNDIARPDCNLRVPLWQLVRASTAAPVYFPPEVLRIDPNDASKAFVFVDGGVTPYNNPAFLLYRFATEPAYRLEWPRGEQKLLLVSVGTGAAAIAGVGAEAPARNMFTTSLGVPNALLYGSLVDQDVNCRMTGRCTHGDPIDHELADMVPRQGHDEGPFQARLARPMVPLSTDLGRAFLYARYNVDLTEQGLARLGFPDVDAATVQRLDCATPDHIALLMRIGRAASAQVRPEHFGTFLPAGPRRP
jgi:uncharacterized protein